MISGDFRNPQRSRGLGFHGILIGISENFQVAQDHFSGLKVSQECLRGFQGCFSRSLGVSGNFREVRTSF